MDNKRNLYIIIVLLCIWNLVLSLVVFGRKSDSRHNEINEYDVSGFSTDLSKVYDSNRSSIVSVEQGSEISTGFIYEKEGDTVYIVSSYHGVSGNGEINVRFNNGSRVRAEVRGYDVFADVAVLMCEFPFEVRQVTVGDSSLSKAGEFVLGIGNSGTTDYELSAQFGMISSPYREIVNEIYFNNERYEYYSGLMQLSGAFLEGFSGSPLFNMNGEVIGMITMKDEDIVLAVTVNELSIIADAIIADEPLSKLQMGISGRYLCDMEKYETVALNINVETVSGYYVDNVRTNSLGSRLGLQRGDIIISINGIPVEDRDVMLQILYSEINEIELVISRNGEESTLRGSISRDD